MKKIQELNPNSKELLELKYKYNYQSELTNKLDNLKSDFNQELINEIVLWKVNRYAKLNNETINLINKIDPNSEYIDVNLTKDTLIELLKTKGIRLPMASTILRFRNPEIYQIIDQRVYRLIYGKELKLSIDLDKNITLYLDYLTDLKKICDLYQIPFSESDRVLYEYDKIVNKDKTLN